MTEFDVKAIEAKKPEEVGAIKLLVGSAVQYVEDNRPELKGRAKTEAVVDQVEQAILNMYRFTDMFADFPPVIDLAFEMGVPHLTETTDAIKHLRPLIESIANQAVNLFKPVADWFESVFNPEAQDDNS